MFTLCSYMFSRNSKHYLMTFFPSEIFSMAQKLLSFLAHAIPPVWKCSLSLSFTWLCFTIDSSCLCVCECLCLCVCEKEIDRETECVCCGCVWINWVKITDKCIVVIVRTYTFVPYMHTSVCWLIFKSLKCKVNLMK
jgi:hypothetical protein